MRSRASARKAGTSFESLVRNFWRNLLPDNNIQRAARWGSRDEGDITGVKVTNVIPVTTLLFTPTPSARLAVECKDVRNLSLPAAIKEAKVEAANAGADLGVVIHKRRGSSNPNQQFVTMELGDFGFLVTGRRHEQT